VLATEVGFLQRSLLTQELTGTEWLACISLALALPLVIEGSKWIRRRRAPKPPAIDAVRAVAPARAHPSVSRT
jgi:Ca2+-transporting ATPase